jgi:hypothetical protein
MPSWVVRYQADATFETVVDADTLKEAHAKFDAGDYGDDVLEIECIDENADSAKWTEN